MPLLQPAQRPPLPAREFDRRHRGLLWLLAFHLVALPIFGLTQGWSTGASLAVNAPAAAFGALALVRTPRRHLRATCSVLALLCCSAALVWLWRGQIEAHFHYFVVVGAVALYEAALPYAIAIVFVVVQHGAMSAWVPHRVFDHHQGMTNPWMWAAIHGGFIAALAIANLVSWRASADTRARELHAQGEALRSTRRFQSAFDEAPNGTALLDAEGRMVEVNPALAAAARSDVDTLRGRPWFELLPDAEREGARAAWPPAADSPEREHRLQRADGSTGWMLWKHSRTDGAGGDEVEWISQTVDVSRRKFAEDELAYQADHDALTGLPNRSAFHRLATEALATRTPGHEIAILFADVDDFKVVNDSLGHAAGDALLVAVVERLRSKLRAGDRMGRFGGDEIVVCLHDADQDAAGHAADRLASALAEPFELGGVIRSVTASIGVAVSGEGADTVEALLSNADAAMYAAKSRGKARWAAFGAAMRDEAVDRLQLESDLRGAVEREEIEVHYQPQVRMDDGHVLGVEALARWTHPVRGNVPPGVFIPIAERSGLVDRIGLQVLRQACRQLHAWDVEHPHLSELTVSVNASAEWFTDPELPRIVAELLAETGVAAHRVCIEVTERAVVDRGETTAQVVAALKALGLRLAIDDFGVGTSSLSQLARLRVLDELKVDKSLVDELDTPQGAMHATLIGAIVGVASRGGVEVVVEGVERASQLERLQALGCTIAQGFLFSRPLPADEALAHMLDRSRQDPVA